MNPYLILGPIGIIIIGLGFIIYWFRKKKVKLIIFAWGGLLWFIAVTIKGLMDSFLLGPFYEMLYSVSGVLLMIVGSLIVGLRTGFLESGISYLMIKGRLKKLSWDKAIGLGIGFGATEAIALGAISLMTMLMIFNPTMLEGLSEAELATIEAAFSQNTLVSLAAWIERFFTILAHIFATALVVKSLTTKNLKYLWISIAYKSALDLPVPLFQSLISDGNLIMAFVSEAYIVAIGLIGFYALKWLKVQKK